MINEDKHWVEVLIEKYDTWEDLVKDLIKDRLWDYENNSYYGCDLGYQLFEGENVDGSFTYSTYWSKELVKTYWDELGEIYDNYIWNVGSENSINVLDEPEKFIVVMLLEKSNDILGRLQFINDNWDNEIELNKENIETIISQLGGNE